jgi:fructose-1,6-bisphosphatase I / sedoheptulose-1,7-bisphosphatase
MNNKIQTDLSSFLVGAQVNHSLAALICAIAEATKAISALTENGAINNNAGENIYGKLNSENVQGETQATLDVICDKIFTARLAASGLVAGMVSEEVDLPIVVENKSPQAEFLVIFDPLDGSSNVDVNVSIGSIFSVLKAPNKTELVEADYLISGQQQLAAGYALYGPCTMLVITTGNGTHGFTLNRATKEFLLTHPNMQVPEDTKEYAINSSNQRFWEPPIKRYVTECKAGAAGRREKDFNMRWVGSMVAEIHRILMRGGIYLYPKDNKDLAKAGRLRLMYEASPMAMLIEQAGGGASTGRMRILDVEPKQIHQRIPIIIGSKNEVVHVVRYHEAYDKGNDEPFPLFNERTFYR